MGRLKATCRSRVHPLDNRREVYPYERGGNSGFEVHQNERTNLRYTQHSKLTNSWYVKEVQKCGTSKTLQIWGTSIFRPIWGIYSWIQI